MNPEQLIDLSLKLGASEVEVYQSSAFSQPIFFEANRLKQLESSQSEGIALRLWKEGSPGLAVAYGEVEPLTLVEKAIALSELNSPEIPELSEPRTEIYTEPQETVSVEALVKIGKESITQIRDIYPDVLCSGEFEAETENTLLMNSQGLHCQWKDYSISYYLGVEWIRGEDFLGIYDGDYSKTFPNPQKVIQSLLQRLEWASENAPSPIGNVPILLTSNAATLLWETVSEALNSKRILDQSSPWSNKQDQAIISPKITLSQDPTLSPHNCPFDDEGTPTQKLSLITQGHLKTLYSDRKRARQLGLNSTGNGFRLGLGTYPSPSLVNLIIEAGDGDLSQFIQQIDTGLLIDQVLGERADISGDMSVNIDLGYRIEKGKIVGRVKDTMVSGNIYTALQEIQQIGSDRHWNGSCYTPSIQVGGLTVVGAG